MEDWRQLLGGNTDKQAVKACHARTLISRESKQFSIDGEGRLEKVNTELTNVSVPIACLPHGKLHALTHFIKHGYLIQQSFFDFF